MYKLLILFSLIPQVVFGKSFSNQYIQFELPPGWECALEGSEYVCQSNDANRKKEAIIILAAKKRGPQDNIGQYQAYLKQAKTYQLPGAKVQRSEPKVNTTQTINGQQWVDALHLASEVPGFYTRYLATVKSDIGVAVTFSVTKSLYNVYKDVFDEVIASMKVFTQVKPNLAQLGGRKKGAGLGDETFVPQDHGIELNPQTGTRERSSGSGGGSGIIILLAIAGGVGFVLMKLKKKKS